MTIGSELRQAREHARLSALQISERTKIQQHRIDALENNAFEQLPQGIYLDGIVRAYAQEVGIDPERMVERARLQRGKLPGDWEVPFAAHIDLYGPANPSALHTIDVPELDDSLDSFAAESDLAPIPSAQQTPEAHEYYVPRVPARPKHARGALAVPFIALLAVSGLGMYFYQSAPPFERGAAQAAVVSEPGPGTSHGTTDTAPVPFSENVLPAEPQPRATSGARASAVTQDTPSISDTVATPAREIATAPPSSEPRTRAGEPAVRAAAPAQPDRIVTPGSLPDVTGSWRLATQVESSSLSRFAGLKLGYEMELEQDGDRVTGTGRKITENGTGIVRRAQTPVTVSGTIAGDRLTLNFVERGARRPTQGKFVLLVDEAGTLRGRFSSDAARSSGRVEAHRVSTQ